MSTNSVQVDPGGATYPTITAALDSITDASVDNQYELWVSAGTYDEQVTLKPYVTVRGAGPDQTTITQQASDEYGRSGTVIAASNAAIESVTIVSTAGPWGMFAIPLYAAGASPFAATNCTISSNPDNTEGNNPTACAVNLQVSDAPSDVQLSYCTVQSSNFGIGVGSQGSVTVNESSVVAAGGDQCWGAFTSGDGSSIELVYSKIVGRDFALNVDGSGAITAINCTIDGPVAGAKIINDPPPSD